MRVLFHLRFPGWLFMAAVMFLLYFVQRARKDAGIVDVGWAAGMGLLAVFYAVTASGDLNRRVILAVLAGFWSFRLASHLLRRYFLPKRGRPVPDAAGEMGGKGAGLFFHLFPNSGTLGGDVLRSFPGGGLQPHSRP